MLKRKLFTSFIYKAIVDADSLYFSFKLSVCDLILKSSIQEIEITLIFVHKFVFT